MTLTPWQHATLSVGLTLVVTGLLFFILVSPALSGRAAYQERLEALQFQLQNFSMAVEQTSILETELAALASREINQANFLEQKSRALAAADLQRLLDLLIEETGGILISTQVLPDTGNNSIFPEITVSVHLRGATTSLQKLLYRLDSGQPLLFMDNLLIQKRRREDERGRRAAHQLNIRFDVTAFIYRPEAS